MVAIVKYLCHISKQCLKYNIVFFLEVHQMFLWHYQTWLKIQLVYLIFCPQIIISNYQIKSFENMDIIYKNTCHSER